MAVDILFFGGFKDGEIALDAVDAAANPYMGGSPAALGASGAKLAVTPDIIGVFKNSSVLDLQGDVQVAEVVQTDQMITTIIFGTNKLKLFVDGADAAPYAIPPTGGGAVYALNDMLYVDAAGVWDNNPVAVGDGPGLKVVAITGLVAGPDALDVYQFSSGIVSVGPLS